MFLGCVTMFYLGLNMFFYTKKYILVSLMVLEFLSVTLLMMLVGFSVMVFYDLGMLIYVVITLVCEAVMGLVLLMVYVRSHGSDYFQTSSSSLC